MSSKDDDTLPLSGFSEELSVDVTVDEDFIPTSQPQSSGHFKGSKTSDLSVNKSMEELKSSATTINTLAKDTLPVEAVINQSTIDRDRSADFIPDTETKLTKISYAKEDLSCKKKLPVFGPDDIEGALSNSLWDTDVSKIPESPALETQNFYSLNESLVKSLPVNQELVKLCEDSVTEIIVNDSSETVDLETTPMRAATLKCEFDVEKLGFSSSSNSYPEKCEETQIFDRSVLVLDQPGSSGLHKSENISGVTSEKLYLKDTVEDNVGGLQKTSVLCSKDSPPAADELSEKLNVKEEVVKGPKINSNGSPAPEAQENVNSTESESDILETRKIELKFSASCFVSFNPKTNKVLHKVILSVDEIFQPKTKPKPAHFNHISDSASEKSKRQSTSSSGSVYSDKTGLPFALSVRVSAVSDQTDSSEDELAIRREKERRALERVPWSNEYLLPLKLDEMLQAFLENSEPLRRSSVMSPTGPQKRVYHARKKHLKEVSNLSLSEQTSICSEGSAESQAVLNADESPGEKKTENEEETKEKVENAQSSESEGDDKPDKQTVVRENGGENKEAETEREMRLRESQTLSEEGNVSVVLCDGLSVFARWTDKRYYSGVLFGDVKNERWEVKFDDGTVKTVREDFIMPTQWVKVGSLVFALSDDHYRSGQIVDIKRGEEYNYVVELDTEKNQVSVKLSDLCLTDVMAGIVREKYTPLGGTPRGKADIDFDNVVSGKRIREQRTPLRPPAAVQPKNSGSKRKLSSSSSSKTKKDVLESIKETSQDTESKISGLNSENGHLVEDKVVSADSPSGNEEGKTPLRGSAREPKRKAKPRSLSYEAEVTRSGIKSNSWMTSEGTPIPGPSGVKNKKQKTKNLGTPVLEKSIMTRSSKKSFARAKDPVSAEKSKRKRKLEESFEDVQKKPRGKGKSKGKRG